MCAKQEVLPADIEWHFIGHLQTNKVKYIAPFVSLVHSVDSLKLLKIINKEAEKNQRTQKCLLQFHIAEEETKFGFSQEEAVEMLESAEFRELKNVEICGVMGMATFTDNDTQIRKEFRHLRSIFEFLKEKYFATQPSFCELSMGMSGDYRVAISEGSTMVRIGSNIFGERNYTSKT
jgi:pyridoxal phosphate enzyme (YggS family)